MDKPRFLHMYTVVAAAVVLALYAVPITYLVVFHVGLLDALRGVLSEIASSSPTPEFRIVEVRRGYSVVLVAFRGLDLGIVANSVVLALFVSCTATLLGLFTALVSYLYRLPKLLVYAPIAASIPVPFVKAVAVYKLLDPSIGLVNVLLQRLGIGLRFSVEGLAAVALYQVMVFYPVVHLMVFGYLSSLPREFLEAAYMVGAGVRRASLGVLLPLARPAAVAGMAMAFILSLDDLEAPLVFEKYPAARNLLVYRAYRYFLDEVSGRYIPSGVGYAAILLALSIAVFAVSYKYIAVVYRSFGAAILGGGRRYRLRIAGARDAVVVAFMVVAILTALVPTAVAVVYAFSNRWVGELLPELGPGALQEFLGDPSRVRAVLNSAVYSLAALGLALALSLPASYYTARRAPLSKLLDAVFTIPMVVPGIVVAYSYIALFKYMPGPLNIFSVPQLYLVVAYAIRRITYVYKALQVAVTAIPRDLEEASYVVGARDRDTLIRVVAPLAVGASTPLIVFASIHLVTEVSTSITIGALGPTMGWGSTAPVSYVVFRDITISSLLYVGAAVIEVFLSIAVTLVALLAVLKLANIRWG